MSRLPALGPRGEGWFGLQLVLGLGVWLGSILTGGQWSGRLGGGLVLVGLVMVFAGAAVVARATYDLRASLSPLPRPRDDAQLVDRGLYRVVRHPIYAGLIPMAFGWALAMMSWLGLTLAAGLVVLLDLKARREEAWLRERYPGYASYARRVRRFIPRLY